MSKRVLIVGAGVVGLSAAWHAAQKGHSVTVVDGGAPDDPGCSFGNAGMVTPSHFVPLAAPGMVALGLRYMLDPAGPFYVKPRLDRDLLRWGAAFWRASNARAVARAAPVLRDLLLASRAGFVRWSTLWPDFGFTPAGLYMLCESARSLEHEARGAEHARTLGIPAEVLSGADANAHALGVGLDVAGAVFYPLDCHLVPQRLMETLRRETQKAGGAIAWGAPVTGWRARDGRIEAVRTPGGDLEADEFVVCAGVWSADLARQLDLRLPMQAGKGYSLTLAEPRRLPRTCAILVEARLAVTPMEGALRVGGTMELSGSDMRIDPRRVRGIVKSFVRRFPDFHAHDFDGVVPWAGLRPCSPDGLPYLGRTKRYANLTTATGHAMMGVSLAPVTGRLVAEIVSGEPPSIDLAALDPDRYA